MLTVICSISVMKGFKFESIKFWSQNFMVDVAIHAILPNIYISSPALVRGSLRDATRGRDVATG